MKIQPLGKLFDVSRYTLGGGGIGQVWGSTTRDEAIATVHAAHDAGINLFDMAPLYGRGEAETVMGLAFPNGYPEDIHVTTKCMLGSAPPEEIEQILTKSLEESLQRLKRSSIDIFILHGYVIPDQWQGSLRPDVMSRIAVERSIYDERVVPGFEKLKESGRIGAWGITAASVQEINLQVLDDELSPDVVQCVTNILDSPGNMAITDETPAPRAIIEKANDQHIGVMGIRAVAAGSLTSEVDRDIHPASAEQRDFKRAESFRAIAAELGRTPAELAHQYALEMPGVSTVVLGVKNRVELSECLAAESAPAMDESLIQRIDASVSRV